MRVLEWSLRNWDPLKGARRLPRFDLSESGHDIIIQVHTSNYFSYIISFNVLYFIALQFLRTILVEVVSQHIISTTYSLHHPHHQIKIEAKNVLKLESPKVYFSKHFLFYLQFHFLLLIILFCSKKIILFFKKLSKKLC